MLGNILSAVIWLKSTGFVSVKIIYLLHEA